jgi:hypothetical protein
VTSQTVSVTVLARKTGTVNKSFTVTLAGPSGATLGSSTSTVTITGTTAQVAVGTAPVGVSVPPLSADELQPVVAAAEQRWAALGASPAQLAADQFMITTLLPSGEIGFTDGNTIYIDATAAGFGWYTGVGSAGVFGSDGLALPGGPAVGHMDLLTVVLHEIGHTLGLPDDCGCGPYGTLMQATLPAGVRRSLPNAPAGSAVAVLAPSGSAGTAPAPATNPSTGGRAVPRPAGVRAPRHHRLHRSHRSRARPRHRHRLAGSRSG